MPGLSRHLLIATTLLLTFLLNVEAWTNIGYSPVTLLQDTPFYVHPHILTNLCDVYDAPKLWNTEEFVGVTIISINKTSIDRNDLQAVIASNLAQDDVFNTGFLQVVLVRSASDKTALKSVSGNISDLGIRSLEAWPSHLECDAPDGPYILRSSDLTIHVPYRIYSDTQEAFVAGVVPSGNSSFRPIEVNIPGASSVAIGVPSRLYYSPTPEKPLAGVRVGIKDIYNIRGIKTGAGSRAYYDVSDEANATAPAVQRLIDAGAIVVGKMKTSQFAAPEFARVAIDYQAPFNARGDGYQDPGSSSSGPGAGMGSYDWLDLALGSDTGGSIRVPAQLNGVFGLRPSHGHAPLDGALPLAPQFDTAGLLARDPTVLRSGSRALYSNLSTNYTSYPRRIQTVSIKAVNDSKNTAAENMMSAWVSKLATFLSAETVSLNYTRRWAESPPANATSDLDAYMGDAWVAISAIEQTRLVRDSFYEAYAAKFEGRRPFVNPSTRQIWNWSDVEKPSLGDALTKKATFKEWWNGNVILPDPQSCSDSLVIYSGADALGVAGSPSDRDILSPFSGLVKGLLGGLFISPFAEGPDFAITIGEVAYNSTITQRQEYIPVSVDILAAQGCDMMLLDLLQELAESGLVSAVKPGSSISGGQTYIK